MFVNSNWKHELGMKDFIHFKQAIIKKEILHLQEVC